jgi:CheY-like chemotaxis protein
MGVTGAILIVEDADTSRETLEMALAGSAGLEARLAGSGAEALRILHEAPHSIRVIVTDLNMPAMDGLELIRRIRSDRETAGIPVIVISGDPDPKAPSRALGVGADAYFSKPYSPAIVRQMLEQLLHATRNLEPKAPPADSGDGGGSLSD